MPTGRVISAAIITSSSYLCPTSELLYLSLFVRREHNYEISKNPRWPRFRHVEFPVKTDRCIELTGYGFLLAYVARIALSLTFLPQCTLRTDRHHDDSNIRPLPGMVLPEMMDNFSACLVIGKPIYLGLCQWLWDVWKELIMLSINGELSYPCKHGIKDVKRKWWWWSEIPLPVSPSPQPRDSSLSSDLSLQLWSEQTSRHK